MNTQETAKKFIEFYKSENPLRKYELYSEDCVSIEAPLKGDRLEIIGLEQIIKKHHEFYEQFSEIYNKSISEPLIGDAGFAIIIAFDVKKSNKRISFKELCVFHVRDGEIIRQEFIY